MRILYLFRAPRGTDRAIFCAYVKDFTTQNLLDLAESVTIALTLQPPPLFNVIPFRRDLIALISLDGVTEPVWPEPGRYFAGAYRADAFWPVVNRREWRLGDMTPGAGLLTLFRQKKGLSSSEFLKRWYEGHTALTLEVHPNVGYVRNRVTAFYEDAGSSIYTRDVWDGIVEEQYSPVEDLLHARRFFGAGRHRILSTMVRVYRDVKGFIDYGSIQTWFTHEFRLKESSEDIQR